MDGALFSVVGGLVAVNVGNGYGAACAALRVLRQSQDATGGGSYVPESSEPR